jgi:hypothetical protein
MHQGTKIEEIQAISQSRKNRTIRFVKPDSDFSRTDRVQLGFVI